MLLPEDVQGVGRLEHGLQYLAGGLQRPVRADGDMLPADEIRDIVDMIEHDGNRRVGLIGEKRGDGDDADDAAGVGDGLEAIVALPSSMVEDGFCGRMIGGAGLPGNTARVQRSGERRRWNEGVRMCVSLWSRDN